LKWLAFSLFPYFGAMALVVVLSLRLYSGILAVAWSASIVSRLAAASAKCMGIKTTPGLHLVATPATRTAPTEATGNAITFVTPADEPIICDIQQLIGKRLERCTVPGFDYGVAAPSYAWPTVKELQQQSA
jgi:hypothetical protein